MAKFRTRFQGLAAFIVLLGLSGCPLFLASPKLLVTPASVNFGAAQSVRTITITNEGGLPLAWDIEEVSREDENSPWVTSDVEWLSVDLTNGSTTSVDTQVTLTASRIGLPAGVISNTGIRVLSNGGEQVVPVSLVVDRTVFPSTTLISLDPTDFILTFDIINTGDDSANWQLFFVPEPGNPDSATDFPDDFVIVPGDVGSTDAGASTTVTISWTELHPNFDILLIADNGQTLISVQFDAFIPGLLITPDPVILYVSVDPNTTVQPTSELVLTNTALLSKLVSVTALDIQDSEVVPPIGIDPASQIIESVKEGIFTLQVTDKNTIKLGRGNYQLEVVSGDKFTRVGVDVQLAALPQIVLSAPPAQDQAEPGIVPINSMDYGTDSYQETFWVVNAGPVSSELYFKVSLADPEDTNAPVVLDITPNTGDTNKQEADFFIGDENRFVDGQPITVTIDRNALVEDITTIPLKVEATNPDFSRVNKSVPPATILLQITRPPLTIEGPINRARPPYMMRFVLLARDRQGNAIPAETDEDFEKLQFHIFENGLPLDDTETNQFIGKPKTFNLAIVLDYTSSMYNAGTDLIDDPLAKGEALLNMINSTKELIRDLPPYTRIGLFYHHDRSQTDYVMHQFTDDKAALIARLDEFKVPNAQYGSTKIYDALVAAVTAVVAEDPADALPFDDTDVRAVLYVSDGEDNSSIASASTVLGLATGAFVRMYPVAYDPGPAGPTTADMVTLADESGGHFYNAGGNVLNLDKILANATGLTFTSVPDTLPNDNEVQFTINNPTQSTMVVNVATDGVVPWITTVSPSSYPIPGGSTVNVSVKVNPEGIAAGTSAVAKINVTSNLGRGKVYVDFTAMAPANDIAVASLGLTLVDQPGKFWDDQQNQFMLTYNTPSQVGGVYNIQAIYEQPDGELTTGFFERNGLFIAGDPLAGQISLVTEGINSANQAVIHVRADYIPRNVNRFRMRFYTQLPLNPPPAAVAAFNSAVMTVTLDDEDSLLIPEDPNAQGWNLVNEGDGSYLALTEQDNPLRFSSFGNLLKITFSNLEPFIDAFNGLSQQPEFYVQMRVDNDIYYAPASPTTPSDTKYFIYPSGYLNPNRPVIVGTRPDLAAPANDLLALVGIIVDPTLPPQILDPENPLAFDIDVDGFRDFNDPDPFDESIPNYVSVPNILEITGLETNKSITVRNNRLDTLNWSVDSATIPSWLTINPAASGVLAPGENQQITLNVNRTGLAWGVYNVELRIDLGIFPDEFIPVSMTVLQP